MKNLLRFTFLFSLLSAFSCPLHGQPRLYLTTAGIITKQSRVEAGISLRLNMRYVRGEGGHGWDRNRLIPTSSGAFLSLGAVAEPVKQGCSGAWGGLTLYHGLRIRHDQFLPFLVEVNQAFLCENAGRKGIFRAGAGALFEFRPDYLLFEGVIGVQRENAEQVTVLPYAKVAVHFSWPKKYYIAGSKYYK